MDADCRSCEMGTNGAGGHLQTAPGRKGDRLELKYCEDTVC